MSKTEAIDIGAQVGAKTQPLEATQSKTRDKAKAVTESKPKGRLEDITKDMTEEEVDAIIGDRKLSVRETRKIHKRTGREDFRVYNWRVRRRLRRADAGKGLVYCDSVEDMFERLDK